MKNLSRRDFLKMAGVTLAGVAASKKLSAITAGSDSRPNIIVIVMDTLSARHMSLHGYPRPTTPNMDAFAERSTVYNNHYSCGNFTTTGTASMLTGMLPWKHRAINYGGLVLPEFAHCNPFSLLGSEYQRFGFAQNAWADHLLGQYPRDIDRFLSPLAYSLTAENPALGLFDNDRAISSIAVNDFLLSMDGQENRPAASSVFGYLNRSRIFRQTAAQVSAEYPRGVPELMGGAPFLNEEVYDGVYAELLQLASQPKPYFAYIHLFSPHDPYNPRHDYRKLFNDDFAPPVKPVHPFSYGFTEEYVATRRVLYDRLIAQVDDEFGRLVSRLDEESVLDNSYLILTSDHGELFERGFLGHGAHFMYESVLRIPLLVHSPGQTKREDVHSLTSNIDLLPTLLSFAGRDPAPELDGRILPGFGGETDDDRPIISLIARENSAFAPVEKAVFSMRRRSHKLIVYLNYEMPGRNFELYNLESDPEELNDLSSKDVKTASAMKDEFFAYLNEANKRYSRK
ncbi:MAG: twin-arginine translocation signal domain-containing protein [Anaerolineaceae bacterium]|jgi:arylsulfatase A-like enzyme|nr:MAG: twin-arginine translocation signal domain-containing protein [Anaerolineaceae bacterium]